MCPVSKFQLSDSSCEEVTLLLCRWCRRVFGCLAVADGETDQSEEHSRFSLCVRSQDFRTGRVQSSPVPSTNSEGMNCECRLCTLI